LSQKYSHAIAAYKEGLKICKDDPSLKKGLTAAKNAKLEGSHVKKSFEKTQATQKASKKRHAKAKEAKTVSSFIEQTRRELRMEMAAIQAQLDLIDELASMSDEEKLDLLFNLIDRDGDGTVDAKELAIALRKRNNDLSFTDSLERAIDMVAIFDTDGDAKLDFEEFKEFIAVMLKELEIDFHEFSEFLVLQILFKDANQESSSGSNTEVDVQSKVKDQAELHDMLLDKRMMELFKLFDKDGSRKLPFWEVATGLYPATLEMEESVRVTMSLLLMMDKEDKRTLNYEQFGRLVMAIVAAADTTFENISDDLMIALTRNDLISAKALRDLLVDKESKRIAKEMDKERKKDEGKINALQYARLQKLFDLWDIDGDGDITPAELQMGLKKFQDAAGINADAKKEAMALSLGFDVDGDQQLGRREFARAMVHYAKVYKVDLHELIDFMGVATSLGENTQGFQAAYGKALKIKQVPDILQHIEFEDLSD
jgi:Ca2+-binding EF-hand superfamily protein